MKDKKLFRDSIIVGLALFATFFGAGNLVFPPIVGLLSGKAWGLGALGLLLTAIILPVAGMIAVGNSGSDVRCLMVHAHPKFYTISCAIGWFFCSLGTTIPKVAATTHEVGIKSLLPNLPIEVTLVIFFVLLYFFARQKDSVIDKVGKYLTPILVAIMAVILIKGVISPVGTPVETSYVENPLTFSMLQGYLIGDLTLGLMAANIFINTFKSKGYSLENTKKGTKLAGLVCILIMFLIYTGLTYVGAQGGSIYDADVNQTVLLSGMVYEIFGKFGQVLFGLTVAFACLTTGVSVATAIAQFFEDFLKGKLKYNTLLLIICVVGLVLARTGVANVISIAAPIFYTVYPPFIVFTVLGLFDHFVPNDGVYKGAVFTALIFGAFDAIMLLFPGFTALSSVLSYIPLYSAGFGWVVPSILMACIMGFIYKDKPRQYFDLTTETIVSDQNA